MKIFDANEQKTEADWIKNEKYNFMIGMNESSYKFIVSIVQQVKFIRDLLHYWLGKLLMLIS